MREETRALAEHGHDSGLDSEGALRALGEAADPVVELPAFAERVCMRLTHEQPDVCVAAVELLGQLEPATLAPHASSLVPCLA